MQVLYKLPFGKDTNIVASVGKLDQLNFTIEFVDEGKTRSVPLSPDQVRALAALTTATGYEPPREPMEMPDL